MSPRPPALSTQRTANFLAGLTWIRFGVIAVGCVVLFLVGQWVLGWLVVYGLFKFFWGSANDLTGLNPYLLKAIGWTVALLVAYSLCARKLKFLKRWRVLGLLPVLFNIGLYLLTKDLFFRFSDGAPLQWAAITDRGVIYYAKPGFGPDGKPLVRVTAENIQRFKNLGGGLSAVDPEQAEWFSANTGGASIYYYRSPEGDFEFYNRWAHHPGNGQELKPVTPEVRAAYDVWKMERPARELRDKAEQARLERRKEADDTRESRLSEIRTLFRPVVTDSNEVNIALVVMCDSKSVDCDLVTGKLVSGLQSAAPKMVFLQKYYTSDFINKGYFENAYQGDSIVVSEIAGLSPIDYMLLCKVKIVTTPSPSIQGLFTCRIDLAFLLLDQDGRQVNRGSFEALGPGFSAESAVDRGMAMLTQQHSPQFLNGVTSKAPSK